MGFATEKTVVIIPVFNDWLAVSLVVERLCHVKEIAPNMTVILVNDGSSDPVVLKSDNWAPWPTEVKIVNLGCNLGHQRAIAVGMSYALGHLDPDFLIVLDADGEDNPESIVKLKDARLTSNPDEPFIVVAARQKRRESRGFILAYGIYLYAFRLLTGKTLNFGNFSYFSRGAARRLVFMPEVWNHFPSAVLRSNIPVVRVPIDRSTRLIGHSKMNLVALVNHGLSSIAAFTSVVFTRVMLTTLFVFFALVSGTLAVLGIRLGTDLAIPGWATAVLGFLLLSILQVLALVAVMTFVMLANRSAIPVTPRDAASAYIDDVKVVNP